MKLSQLMMTTYGFAANLVRCPPASVDKNLMMKLWSVQLRTDVYKTDCITGDALTPMTVQVNTNYTFCSYTDWYLHKIFCC